MSKVTDSQKLPLLQNTWKHGVWLSLPKKIPIQSLLYKTTTCLARPATFFFVSQLKKNPV